MNRAVWIDHREAVVVEVEEDRETLAAIESADSGYVERGDAQGTASESKGERRREQALDRYYEKVAKALAGARSLYLFGPGEAKHELRHALEKYAGTRDAKVKLESADDMTRNQIEAKARSYFGLAKPRGR